MKGSIRLESYSMGKGYVKWRVIYPPMAKKIRGLEPEFESVAEAAAALKRYCVREQLDPATIALVDRHQPDVPWAAGVGSGAQVKTR